MPQVVAKSSADHDEAEMIGLAKHILTIAKTLKDYPIGDARIAGYLSVTSLAGRAGLLAATLRGHKKLQNTRFEAFCANQAIGVIERNVVVKWLEQSGLVAVERSKGQPPTYTNTVLSYESLLKAVYSFFESLGPTDEERACVCLLDAVSQIPLAIGQAKELLVKSYGEEAANVTLAVSRGFRFVEERAGKGLKEPVLFSPRIWGTNIDRIAKALNTLDRTQREILKHFVGRVRDYQGYPHDLLMAEAKKHNAAPLLELCLHVGLLSATDIVTSDSQKKSFLTTPHFFAEIAAQHGQDVCDRVKIFLDCIRNGQHYGRLETGRIFDPALLLTKLLNTGQVGPCTAIGTDYVVSEKEGIVRVRRSTSKPGQAIMELVQNDTVQKVYEVIKSKALESHANMGAENLKDERTFVAEEQVRVKLAELPGPMQEAERAMLLAIRE